MLRALHSDGFALIPEVLSTEKVANLRINIDRLTPLHWDQTGMVDHYKCVFNRDPFWLPYLDFPGIIELAEAALGKDCHVIGQTAWRCPPGFSGVQVHADYVCAELPEEWASDPRFELPMHICTAQFYLNDITEDLCPTKVIPGSHKSGRYPQRLHETSWNGREAEAVLCKAGDVLFFRSDLWHSGSVNWTRNQTRYLLQVHYGRRMVAQKFSPYIDWKFNPEVLASCTPRQRRLLGDHGPGAYD
jgi:ectoine hydroxylase-related dioxygenase (phytanoyl-CoA dioxygenase family)